MVGVTTNFIQETCKDLLIVVQRHTLDEREKNWDVEFLHRTVSDFLCDGRVRLFVKQHSPEHFADAEFPVGLGKLRVVGLLGMK